LADAAPLRELDTIVARDRSNTANLLAHIAEVDARRIYRAAGHTSMFAYCVDRLHLSEGAAYKRIQAARAAREFPVLFAAVEDGKLHLSAVCLLRPHLTAENLDELVAAATHRRKSEVESWLARRFPQEEDRTPQPILRALPARAPAARFVPADPASELSPGTVGALNFSAPVESEPSPTQLSPGTVATVAAAPLPTERYLLRLTIDKGMHDKIRQLRELLSHAVPSGDVAQVLERALDLAIAQLQKSKYAATEKPRVRTARPPKGRHIPADVRRAVRERDQGRCTFEGDGGHRCGARAFVQFDHARAFALGGEATVEGTRLLCGPHNQLEAERVFGAEFMSRKREERLAMLAPAR
jgi:hypothetical protein